MNDHLNDKQLDALLADWSGCSESTERLDGLHDRIVSALTSPDDAETGSTLAGSARTNQRKTSASLVRLSPRLPTTGTARRTSGIAVAVSIVSLLAVLFLVGGLDGRATFLSADTPPDYAWLQDDQMESKAVLLREMDSLFDRKLAWLAETNNRMDFQLVEAEVETPVEDSADRLAVRVVVERRSIGSSAWQLAWKMDVISRSEELINVMPSTAGGNELRLWAYRLPDGVVAVDSALQLAGTESFSTETSGLHHDGTPVKVASAIKENTEYRVFQSVAVLDRNVGQPAADAG